MEAMNRLQRVLSLVEDRLQSFFEGRAMRLFPGRDFSGLAQQLVTAMKSEIQSRPDGGFLAPNVYIVTVHPSQEWMLPEKTDLLNRLTLLIQHTGEETHITFPSPPVVRVILDTHLHPRDIQVLATFSDTQSADTTMIPLVPNPEFATNRLQSPPRGFVQAPDAFLIVDGNQTVPVPRQGLTIGRQSNVSLVIDEPYISRVHAQIRLVQGRYMIFDLESRAGTYVNGQRVTQSVLHPGDVISLADVQLVFGQESHNPLNDTQEIRL